MIQKIDHLKQKDLVFIVGKYQNQIGLWHHCKIRDGVIVSINYLSLSNYSVKNPTFYSSIRWSMQQRVFKITKDNLTKEELELYKQILKSIRNESRKIKSKK